MYGLWPEKYKFNLIGKDTFLRYVFFWEKGEKNKNKNAKFATP